MSTFDGRRYDFQAVGEYTLVRSTEDDLEVQLRLEPYGESDRHGGVRKCRRPARARPGR
jgi:hypothetical protein